MRFGRTILGLVLGLSPAVAVFAQTTPADQRAVVGALPEHVDLVIGARSLTTLRGSPAGKALERFLGEASGWDRSFTAWQEFSRRLDLDINQAVDSVLGTSAVLAVDGAAEQNAPLRFAVVTLVRPDERQRLAQRLGAVPRSVVGNVPVLAVESGAFHLAMPSTPGSGEWARLVLASDKPLFDKVINLLPGGPSSASLKGTPEWPRIEPLAGSDLFVLARGRDALGAKEGEFLAIGATSTPRGLTARFTASDAVIGGGIAGMARTTGPWPSEAVDHLEQNATLFIAGSPSPDPASPGTLMGGFLTMLGLPDRVRSHLEGTAIVAMYMPESQGGSLVLALPLRSIANGVDAADAWAASVAGLTPADESVETTDGIRQCPLAAEGRGMIGGFAKGSGRLAWCYAAQGGILHGDDTPGWLVLAAQFGPGEAPQATVRRTAGQLAHEPGTDRQTLFRLVLEPRKLTAVLKPSTPKDAPAGSALPVDRSALRWLDRVDSRIVRESKGYVEGTINIDLNLGLLASPPAPPPAQGEQPAGQGQ